MKFILASVFVLEVFSQESIKYDFDITNFFPVTTHGLVPLIPSFKTEVKNYTGLYPSLHFTDKDYELIRAKVVDPKVFRSLLVENVVNFDVTELSLKASEVNGEILSLTKIVRESCLIEANKIIDLFKTSIILESTSNETTLSPTGLNKMAKFAEKNLDIFDIWFQTSAYFASYVNTLFLATRPAYNADFAKTVNMFITGLENEFPKEAEAIKNHTIALQTQYSFIPDAYYSILNNPYFN